MTTKKKRHKERDHLYRCLKQFLVILPVLPFLSRTHIFTKQLNLQYFLFYFIFGCPGSLLLRVGFLQLQSMSWGSVTLQCMSFSLQWLFLLQSMGCRDVGFSGCGSWTLEQGFSSCGPQAQLPCSIWNLPRSRIKPMFPVLANRSLFTAPPQKS